MKRRTVLTILLAVLAYLAGGAALFQRLEQPLEQRRRGLALGARLSFLQQHRCVQPQDLDTLIQELLWAVEVGVDPTGNSTNFTTNWDMGGAFFFAGTVITTIGFGNIAPKTDGGRLFCIFYALVGIPMFGSLLAGVGDQLGSALGQLIGKVEQLFLRWRVRVTVVRVVSALLFLGLGCLMFVFSPVVVFQWVEGWSTLEAAYFVVITLTTIGFGDYVAGSDPTRVYKVWYKPLVWVWVVLGLAYFVAILSMIGDWLRVLSRRTREEMEGFTTQAANWTSAIATDIKGTRWDPRPLRQLSPPRPPSPSPPPSAPGRERSRPPLSSPSPRPHFRRPFPPPTGPSAHRIPGRKPSLHRRRAVRAQSLPPGQGQGEGRGRGRGQYTPHPHWAQSGGESA